MKNLIARLYGKEEGFTLIELLVVVAIIALLATFAVPKLFDAINKSKNAPGQSDMQTISGALERYYMDNTGYPTAANMQSNLTNGYVKTATSFVNGFKNGYMYFTDANGSFYVLVDPQNKSGTVTITCNSKTDTATVGTALVTKASTTIAASDVAVGCTVDKGSIITN